MPRVLEVRGCACPHRDRPKAPRSIPADVARRHHIGKMGEVQIIKDSLDTMVVGVVSGIDLYRDHERKIHAGVRAAFVWVRGSRVVMAPPDPTAPARSAGSGTSAIGCSNRSRNGSAGDPDPEEASRSLSALPHAEATSTRRTSNAMKRGVMTIGH